MSRAASILVTVALGACTLAPPPGGLGEAAELPAPGSGTLRQDDVSVVFSSGDIQIKVTPLSESVTRVTAPDTYRRLSGLAASHAPEVARRSSGARSELFLVSFFSESADVAFVPEELQIIARGIRLRPEVILPITPGWGQRRLAQRETEMAVYAFGEGLDLESEMVVVYGLVQSGAWAAVLLRVQAERARARSRG